MTFGPDFKVTTFFEVEYQKNGHVLKTKLLLHKRTVYLPYGMVLCLVTLSDLEMCRSGLSASAELLVQLGTASATDSHSQQHQQAVRMAIQYAPPLSSARGHPSTSWSRCNVDGNSSFPRPKRSHGHC